MQPERASQRVERETMAERSRSINQPQIIDMDGLQIVDETIVEVEDSDMDGDIDDTDEREQRHQI